MLIPTTILQPRNVPRSLIKLHIKDIEDVLLQDCDFDKDANEFGLSDLTRMLIAAEPKPSSFKGCFSSSNEDNQRVLEADLKDARVAAKSVKYLFKGSNDKQPRIEIQLLKKLNLDDLEAIASKIKNIEIAHNPEGNLFSFVYLEPSGVRTLLATYCQKDRKIDDVFIINPLVTHMHSRNHGCMTIEDYNRMILLCGSFTAFSQMFGSAWHPLIAIPTITIQLIDLIEDCIRNSLPIDFFNSTVYQKSLTNPCWTNKKGRLIISSQSISVSSLVDSIISNKRDFIDISEFDVACSASQIFYRRSEDREYIDIGLIKNIGFNALRDIVSNVPNVSIVARCSRGMPAGYEFVYQKRDRKIILGRYLRGDYSDKPEIKPARLEIYLMHYYNKKYGYIPDEDFQEAIKRCGSQEVFNRFFSKEWKPAFMLPDVSRKTIDGIDYYIRQRAFQWLKQYNQGEVATGTVTLLRTVGRYVL